MLKFPDQSGECTSPTKVVTKRHLLRAASPRLSSSFLFFKKAAAVETGKEIERRKTARSIFYGRDFTVVVQARTDKIRTLGLWTTPTWMGC